MSKVQPILIVEDNYDDYESTMRSLQKNHLMIPVQWCKTGQQAIDYIYKQGEFSESPDVKTPVLVLLDLNMPGMNGRDVLEKIKSDPEKRSIPVVMLTTSSNDKDVKECYRVGASTYIQKPVRFEELIEAIRAMKDYWFGVALLPKDDDA